MSDEDKVEKREADVVLRNEWCGETIKKSQGRQEIEKWIMQIFWRISLF